VLFVFCLFWFVCFLFVAVSFLILFIFPPCFPNCHTPPPILHVYQYHLYSKGSVQVLPEIKISMWQNLPEEHAQNLLEIWLVASVDLQKIFLNLLRQCSHWWKVKIQEQSRFSLSSCFPLYSLKNQQMFADYSEIKNTHPPDLITWYKWHNSCPSTSMIWIWLPLRKFKDCGTNLWH
jgi:hypothetical protein